MKRVGRFGKFWDPQHLHFLRVIQLILAVGPAQTKLLDLPSFSRHYVQTARSESTLNSWLRGGQRRWRRERNQGEFVALIPFEHGSVLISFSHVSPQAEATRIRAAISSIDPVKDFSRLGSMPCARSSLLVGMATAAGVAGISLVAGRGLRRGLNWGVGSFCFVSLASWETCRRNFKAEQTRMRTVIEQYRKGGRANQPSLTSLTSTAQTQDAAQPGSAASGAGPAST